jgi:hypothetical protein
MWHETGGKEVMLRKLQPTREEEFTEDSCLRVIPSSAKGSGGQI